MDLKTVYSKLNPPDFAPNLVEAMRNWDGVAPAHIERTVKWVLALRDELLVLIKEIEDEDEIAMTLAVNYIELKSRWMALNTKMNYQRFRTGICETETALRGTAASMLLSLIESLLTQADVDKITEFLAKPITKVA